MKFLEGTWYLVSHLSVNYCCDGENDAVNSDNDNDRD